MSVFFVTLRKRMLHSMFWSAQGVLEVLLFLLPLFQMP